MRPNVCAQRLQQVLAKRAAGLDREVGVVGNVGDAVEVGDLREEEVAHEEVLGQPHAPEILQRLDGSGLRIRRS